MVAISKSNSLYGSQGQPKYITGAYYMPQGYQSCGSPVTTTINRCYYVPIAVWEPHTFQGASTYNQGTGDNGEHIRMMVFNDNGAIGGPGTLAKDFGEITLSGASAQRTLASTWAATPGMYWAAIWHETAAAMYGMNSFGISTAVGGYAGNTPQNYFGNLTPNVNVHSQIVMHYVDTAYGAAPATAVAPTASAGEFATTGYTPIFWLKG